METEKNNPNIFFLTNPDELDCLVENHSASHSVMHIKVFNPISSETQTIEFQLVLYFSGPMSWKGANFQLRPWEECVQLLQTLNKLQHLDEMSLEMQRDVGERHFHLYRVLAVYPKTEITILAGNAQLLSEE
jgi:hypothetical protein